MWETVRLGDVVSYIKNNAQNSHLPYVGLENIASETMSLAGEITVRENTSTTFSFDESHVLYGRLRPYLKKVFLPDFKGQCSTEIFCLQPKSNVLRGFLAYWLIEPSTAAKIESTSTGARMPRANMNALLNFEFPLPPLAEQKRIVERLDKAFAEIDKAIATAEAKEGEIGRLRAVTLSAMLNRGSQSGESITGDEEDSVMWREMPFDSCIKKIKTPPKLLKKLYMETGDYPVVSQEAVHISGYCNDRSKVFRVEKSVVIFGDHTRVCKYVDFDFIVGADGVKIFLPDEGINSKYFYYFILANTPKDKGYARHYRFLKQLTVPIPPLAEQKRIVERLDKAFSEIEIVGEKTQSCVENYSALKSAILKEELTPSEAV